jgi:hypothetical protein
MTVSQEEFRSFALPHANQLLEDYPLWDAGLVATERMVRLSLAQEGTKLLEDSSSGDEVGSAGTQRTPSIREA